MLTPNNTGIYSIQDLELHYRQKTKGHWFDKVTMRFFRSRLSETLYFGKEVIYFVSSELGPHQDKRRYSIRSYNPETGDINTVGEFQAYKTLKTAISAMKEIGE